MPTQHRETDRRLLRETESKIVQTGLSHSRKDWWMEDLHHLEVLERDPRTKTGFDNTTQKSSKMLHWICPEGEDGWSLALPGQ